VGASPVEYAAWKVGESLKNLPYDILDLYLEHAAPRLGGAPASVGALTFNVDSLAGEVFAPQSVLIKGFSKSLPQLSVRQRFEVVDLLNMEKVQDEEWNAFQQQVAAIGGLREAMPPISVHYAEEALNRFQGLVARDSWSIGAGGAPIRFTDEQRRILSNRGTALFRALKNKLATTDIESLSQPQQDGQKLRDDAMADLLAAVLAEKVRLYALTETGETIEARITLSLPTGAPEGTPKPTRTVRLPKFAFDGDVRKQAAELLSAYRSAKEGWASDERRHLHETLEARLKIILDGNTLSAVSEVTPAEAKNWFDEVRRVLSAL
jgi:hypothetical protein